MRPTASAFPHTAAGNGITSSMQLDTWIAHPVDSLSQGREPGMEQAINRNLMLLVERPVHQFGDFPLNENGTTGNRSHQATDSTVITQRHQGAVILVTEFQ